MKVSISLLLIFAFFLSGCAEVPLSKFSDEVFGTTLRDRLRAHDMKNEIRFSKKKGEVCASTGAELRLYPKPFRVTSNTLDKVSFDFHGKLRNLGETLKPYKFYVVVSPDAADIQLDVHFSGKLKDFLESLSQTYGIVVDEHDRIISLKKEVTYTMNLPPYVKEISKYLDDKLKSLYGTSAHYDMITQTVTFTGDANDGVTLLETFQDLLENASLVELEFVIFEGRFGDLLDLGAQMGYKNMTSDSLVRLSVGEASLTGMKDVGLIVDTDHFFSALSALVRQNKARILQKPRLAVLSGTTGKLLIGTETRFLKNGGQTLTGDGMVVTNLDLGEVLDGVDLKVAPAFDPSSHLVYLDLDLLVSEVLGYQKLQIGQKFTTDQPIVNKKQMDLEVPVKAGKIFIFGGISLDSKRTKRGLISRGDSSGKKELIFGIRPRVVKYACGDPLKKYLREHKLTMDDIEKLDTSEMLLKRVLRNSESLTEPNVDSEALKNDLREVLKKLKEAKRLQETPSEPEPVFVGKVKSVPDPTKPKVKREEVQKAQSAEDLKIPTISHPEPQLSDKDYLIRVRLSNGKVAFVKPSLFKKEKEKFHREGLKIVDKRVIEVKSLKNHSLKDNKKNLGKKIQLKSSSLKRIEKETGGQVSVKRANPVGIPSPSTKLAPPKF